MIQIALSLLGMTLLIQLANLLDHRRFSFSNISSLLINLVLVLSGIGYLNSKNIEVEGYFVYEKTFPQTYAGKFGVIPEGFSMVFKDLQGNTFEVIRQDGHFDYFLASHLKDLNRKELECPRAYYKGSLNQPILYYIFNKRIIGSPDINSLSWEPCP